MRLFVQFINKDGQLTDKTLCESIVAREAQVGEDRFSNGTGLYIKVSGTAHQTYNINGGHALLEGMVKGIVISVGE